MFKGVFTAIITPFKKGKIDFDLLDKFIDYQLKNGVHGIVPAGTTGEAATLSAAETKELFSFVVKKINGKAKVIGGTGTNSTTKVIEKTKIAEECGCDGALIVSPYYNKPPQKGLIEHYKKIASEVDIPIVLYNVPGRTSSNIDAETTIELSKIKNIVTIKEASGNIKQISKIIRDTSDDFTVLSGEDMLNLGILSVGGDGFISVVSNIAPKLVVDMYNAYFENNMKKAGEIHRKLVDITETLFRETNPIPVKAGVNILGYCEEEIRLPLVKSSQETINILKDEMKKLNLI